jgi:flagellin-specific chaperone FliS
MENISQKELIEQINSIRSSMIQTGLNKGLNSDETITISQQLDKLLYTYQLLHLSKR